MKAAVSTTTAFGMKKRERKNCGGGKTKSEMLEYGAH